ncbi:SulP family inorganic anion transporter [Marinobacter salicampi]|uniref:SulP family inorganic anion transporter n=1 Tax=Marinobacter salicampi TaxID=435907 RepID=UPI00140A4640|nr:SulP family inorganic anion transporter [Marinobacter salicampi]
MRQRLLRYIPAIGWLRRYDRHALGNDVAAAALVTVIVIPQSLAFALLAGLPAEAGLYASILPCIFYAIFGTSNTLAVGPVALISLMSAAAVGDVATQGTAGFMIASIYLALLSGLILLVMGLLRLGFLSNFISHPVISGFITASGILIAASQMKYLMGIDVPGDNAVELALGFYRNMDETSFPTLALGLPALAFLYLMRDHLGPFLAQIKVSNRVSVILVRLGPVIAVVVATILVSWLNLAQQGIDVVGEVPAGLPPLALPQGSLELIQNLMVPAMLISIVTFVESVSLAHKLAARRHERIDPDQELLGLGTANIASAFSGGFAVAGGFSRSIINYDAGARTPAAGAFTAIGIGLITLFFTPLFSNLPKAVLAAAIIISVLSLVDFRAVRETWKYSRHDGAALVGTIGVTLVFGVIPGILTGIALSLILYLWRTSRPHSALVGRIRGSEAFRNIARHDVETDPRVLILRVDESLYFANARYLEDRVFTVIEEQPQLEEFILMCPAVNYIDASALDSLEAINGRLHDAGIRLHLSEVKGPVMDKLNQSRFLQGLNGDVFMTTYEAWCELRTKPANTDPGAVHPDS